MNEIAIFGVILFIIGLLRHILNDKSAKVNDRKNQPPNIQTSGFQVGIVTNIRRKQALNGISIPSIVNNRHFYLVKTNVYEDGLIDTQGMADLEHFKTKLNNGKICTSLEDGSELFVFSLGKFIITNGEWLHTKETYYHYICSLVKELNPKLENIYSFYGHPNFRRTDRYSNDEPRPYYYKEPDWEDSDMVFGKSMYMIYQEDDGKFYLTEMTIYINGHVEFTNLPILRSYKFEDIAKLIADKKLGTSVPLGERLNIHNLGSFKIANQDYNLDIELKYAEMQNVLYKLKNREDNIDRCRWLLKEYKRNKTQELWSLLKAAYEAIPLHMRIYVGNMDDKDSEVRKILYGENIELDDE